MKHLYKWVSLLMITVFLVTACAGNNNGGNNDMPGAGETPMGEETPMDGEAGDGEPVQFTFWAAPNPAQETFWNDMARQYMDENPNVTIDVSAMPESPSSEAGVQAAIAGGTAPAASENIFIGFGATLYRSDAIVPLNEFEGWQELLDARQMNSTIEGWELEDGNYYILPIYSNAILFGWRTDLLREIGYEGVPTTYDEITGALAEALGSADRELFFWARGTMTDPTWYERWFDFFLLYNAASGGTPLITGDEITADDEAAITVLTFIQELAENNLILTREAQDPFPTGLSVASELGPWTFSTWREQYPELVYGETFELTMPPRPSDVAEDEVRTFADAKGLVIYASVPEEQQQAAWDFITWVYSDPQHDLLWMEQTTLPPARDDLSENEVFQAFFDENPVLAPYAENIPNAVPPLAHPEYTEIQRLLGEEAQIPVINGEKDPETAWNDWKNAVQSQILGGGGE